jgi:hypothetical protein
VGTAELAEDALEELRRLVGGDDLFGDETLRVGLPDGTLLLDPLGL